MSTPDFFRSRLDSMLDLRHPLAVLTTRMPWTDIEAALAPIFATKSRAGQTREGMDLFGPTWEITGAGVCPAGRKRLPIRLMVGLLYLKRAYNESDETVCAAGWRTSTGIFLRRDVFPDPSAVRSDQPGALSMCPVKRGDDHEKNIITIRFFSTDV